MSRGDRYENLSPKEYLDINRPHLRVLINDRKHTTESKNEENDSDNNRLERKTQLVMLNSWISAKTFEDPCTIYSANKPVENFMGGDTKDVINRILIQF